MIGLDVGSTTVKAVLVDPAQDEILWKDYQRHDTKQNNCDSEHDNRDATLGRNFDNSFHAFALIVPEFYPQNPRFDGSRLPGVFKYFCVSASWQIADDFYFCAVFETGLTDHYNLFTAIQPVQDFDFAQQFPELGVLIGDLATDLTPTLRSNICKFQTSTT